MSSSASSLASTRALSVAHETDDDVDERHRRFWLAWTTCTILLCAARAAVEETLLIVDFRTTEALQPVVAVAAWLGAVGILLVWLPCRAHAEKARWLAILGGLVGFAFVTLVLLVSFMRFIGVEAELSTDVVTEGNEADRTHLLFVSHDHFGSQTRNYEIHEARSFRLVPGVRVVDARRAVARGLPGRGGLDALQAHQALSAPRAP